MDTVDQRYVLMPAQVRKCHANIARNTEQIVCVLVYEVYKRTDLVV